MEDVLSDQEYGSCEAEPLYIYDQGTRTLVRRDFDFDAHESEHGTTTNRCRLRELYKIPSPSTLVYNSAELDYNRNEERGYHPRAFDSREDASTKVRLLKVVLLKPKEDISSSIECYFLEPRSLANKTFWNRTKYTALSYTWGPATTPDDVREISIQNEPVCVRRNLWDFLYTMRQAKVDGPFWIDALCIDQLKREEKERQLRLMPKVYAEANTVLVWLGNFGINEVQSVRELHRRYVQRMMRKETGEYDALKYIVENKYWTRLWVVQEIFMAKKIQVYTGSLGWEFPEFADLRVEKRDDSGINWSNWESIVEAKEQWKNKKLDLHEALFRWSGQDCGVTHDKVYGLLGLVSKPQIKINLSISMLGLLEEVLKLERTKIYARGYPYSRDFTAKLLKSLGVENEENAERIKTEFLKGWRE